MMKAKQWWKEKHKIQTEMTSIRNTDNQEQEIHTAITETSNVSSPKTIKDDKYLSCSSESQTEIGKR